MLVCQINVREAYEYIGGEGGQFLMRIVFRLVCNKKNETKFEKNNKMKKGFSTCDPLTRYFDKGKKKYNIFKHFQGGKMSGKN